LSSQLPTVEQEPVLCPEGQVIDEGTGLCVPEEPEAFEESQPEEEQQQLPQEEQPSEDGDNSNN
jgi:hypothetical protein